MNTYDFDASGNFVKIKINGLTEFVSKNCKVRFSPLPGNSGFKMLIDNEQFVKVLATDVVKKATVLLTGTAEDKIAQLDSLFPNANTGTGGSGSDLSAYSTTAQMQTADAAVITTLRDGVAGAGDTLNKLYSLIQTLNAIVTDTTNDGDAFTDTVQEILTVFQTYPEGTNIVTVLGGKLNVSDIINTLTETASGKTLDARQGAALKALIDTLTTASHTHSNKTVLDSITAAYTTSEQTKLAAITGTNTGDQNLATYATKAGAETFINKTISGSDNTFSNIPSSAILPTNYLGQVATRCYLPSKIYTNQQQTMSRSYHYAKDNLTALQVGFTNWFVPESDGTNAETNATANATYTASVEYPLGTFTQLKFSGSATGTGLPGTNTITDALSINIPLGAKFYIRVNRICNSCVYTLAQALNTANGDACDIYATSSGANDKTMGGTIGTGFSEGYFPTFIIAQTAKPTAVLYGDSRVIGSKAFVVDLSGDQGNIAPSIGPYMGYINAGCSGDAVQHFVTNGNSKRAALAQYCSHVVFAYGTNDISAFGRTAAQVIADLNTVVGYFPTRKVFVCTVEPRSTDATTVRSDNASIITINSSIRGGVVGASGTFDISDIVSTGRDTGLWKTGYTNDYVHGNTGGSLAIKNASVINAALFFTFR